MQLWGQANALVGKIDYFTFVTYDEKAVRISINIW